MFNPQVGFTLVGNTAHPSKYPYNPFYGSNGARVWLLPGWGLVMVLMAKIIDGHKKQGNPRWIRPDLRTPQRSRSGSGSASGNRIDSASAVRGRFNVNGQCVRNGLRYGFPRG